jgi:thymidine kinase
LEDYDVIGIDEGQFFNRLSEFCEEMVKSGKIVVVAALNANFKGEGFSRVLELIPKAEKIKKLKSICHVCKKAAHFSKRITEETELEVVGGSDKYVPVCRSHF